MPIVRIPGPARLYLNTDTGETITRRQFDKKYGRLKDETLSQDAIAKKNKLENPELSASRPARGRKKSDEEKQKKKDEAARRAKNRRFFAGELKANNKNFKTKRAVHKKTSIVSLSGYDAVSERGILTDPELFLSSLYAAYKNGYRIFSIIADMLLADGSYRRKMSGYIANPYPFKPKDKGTVIESLESFIASLMAEYDATELTDISIRFLS